MTEISNLPDTMLACQVLKFNEPYVVHHVPVPKTLGPHDLLLKTGAASLCHTDSMVQSGRMLGTKLPITGSHEGAGQVVAVGSEVQGFKPGDRVLPGIPRNRCGNCEDCASTAPQYCTFRDGGVGIQLDGAFAEYLVADSRNSCHIPNKLDYASAAPLACAGITAWGALKQANLSRGDWLGIIGSGGGLGHLAIAFAKAQGIHVVGVDARDEGLELSNESGADLTLDARKPMESLVNAVLSATDNKGVHATINFTEATSAPALGCAITRKHGKFIQVAQPLEVIIPFRELIFRDIKVSGSLTGSPAQTQEMLDFVAEHNIKVSTNVYHGLESISVMVEEAHSGKLKGKGVIVVDKALA